MAAIRIQGTWYLSLTSNHGDGKNKFEPVADARLEVDSANRSGISGSFLIGRASVPFRGRVKPGSPSVVTLMECTAEGEQVADGLEAMLFIAPWWPGIEQEQDLLSGTLVAGKHSTIGKKLPLGRVLGVMGMQPFA
jgi:hypothetical protein